MEEKYKSMKLPIVFLGPYAFKLAPVEKFFGFIKSFELNPLDFNVKPQ